MDEKTVYELVQKREIEDSLKQEFEQSLSDRVARYWQVKPHLIVPNTPFSAPLGECSLLFRDGHFYGCITLTQAVTEALVRLIYQENCGNPSKEFKKNVKKLSERNFISNKLEKTLLKIWQKRNNYHHLNHKVEKDRQVLEELAREKTRLLVEVVSEIFRFTVVNGKLIPEQPKYWYTNDNKV